MAPVDRLEEARSFHAKLMAAASGTDDPRLERVFHLVPREVFMGPGTMEDRDQPAIHRNAERRSDPPLPELARRTRREPQHQQWGTLSSCRLDRRRGAPKRRDRGADRRGTGYYSAILATLVLPDGHVWAYEINEALARRATDNLEAFDTVTVVYADATTAEMPPCDLIYVNAGVVSPPAHWLQALRPAGGSSSRGSSPGCRRDDDHDPARGRLCRSSLGWSWFIPCIGASDAELCKLAPTVQQVPLITEGWLTSERAPDETAVAICASVWFTAQNSLERTVTGWP